MTCGLFLEVAMIMLLVDHLAHQLCRLKMFWTVGGGMEAVSLAGQRVVFELIRSFLCFVLIMHSRDNLPILCSIV
jgi:hypothetical protein